MNVTQGISPQARPWWERGYRGPKGPWTPAEQEQMLLLYGQGCTLGEIARRLGRPGRTVHRHARRAGLVFDDSRTAAATVAHVVDAEFRRAVAEAAMLEQTARMVEQMPAWRPARRPRGGAGRPAR